MSGDAMNHMGRKGLLMDAPRVTLRIPGAWSSPGDLTGRLPEGYRLTPETLFLPDGGQCEFIPMAPDREFPGIFASSCRQPPRKEELAILDRYTVNVGLNGECGSLESALAMMRAAAALVQAGAAGVFNDNSALAHGGRDWIEMTEDGGSDAVSYAFVSVIAGRQDVKTMGMQVLGFPDLRIASHDPDAAGDTIVETVRSLSRAGRRIEAGHILIDENGPRFHTVADSGDEFPPGSPMHNPFGRLKLVSAQEIAEGN
jgi:hypothetical protein